MKIAIVTFEFEGLTRNGGIGTAYRRLADLLVKQGHVVTVIFMPFCWTKQTRSMRQKNELSIKKFARRKIKIVLPESEPPTFFAIHDSFHITRSYLVYEALKRDKFDVIHVSDNCGLAYFSLLARRCKLAFQDSRFVVGTHGCPLWTAEANGIFSEVSVMTGPLDQRSIEMADYVVSPSAYMLNFRKAKGWHLPADSRVIANVNDLPQLKLRKVKPSLTNKQKTLVFFGRMEKRKGVFMFIKAIENLLLENPEIGVKQPLEVIFLGSSPDLATTSAFEQALDRLNAFGDRLKIRLIQKLSSNDSLDFLASHPGQLVCMPSLLDNFPYVIVEAVERRLDFIASNAGGQAEIILAQDRAKVLCAPTAAAWTEAILNRLSSQRIEARPSLLTLAANRSWLAFHAAIGKSIRRDHRRKKVPAPQPKVSIALISLKEEHSLNTLRDVLLQDYPNLEILLPRDFQVGGLPRHCKTYDPKLRRPSEIANVAKGKYVLFADGGFLQRPSALREWVTACENLSTNEKKYVGFAAVINQLPANKPVGLAIPLPSEATRAMVGQCLGNTFTLWHRRNFLAISRTLEANLSNDLAIRPFIARAVATGLELGTIPLEVITNSPARFIPHWDIEHFVSPIEAFAETNFPTSETLVKSLVAFYNDMRKFRELYYQQTALLEKNRHVSK